MNYDYTHISILLDRSGSMSDCHTAMVNGLNSFISEQKKVPGKCTVSLYQFDDQFETMFELQNLDRIGPIELVPRGLTALLDSFGRSVIRTGHLLSTLNVAERPAKVLFMVITDGLENSSHEFDRYKILNMVNHQKVIYNWHFVYLGANQNSFLEGQKYGVKGGSSWDWQPTQKGVNLMIHAANSGVTCARTKSYGAYCESVSEGSFFNE